MRVVLIFIGLLVFSQLASAQERPNSWLGVTLQKVTEEDAQKLGLKAGAGAKISDIVPGGGAEEAGLILGDIILSIDAKDVVGPGGVAAAVAALPPGTEVKLRYSRNGAERMSVAKLRARPKAAILQLDTGGHMALIRHLAFTPDGKYLISAGDDKVIRIWDWKAAKTMRTLRGEIGAANDGKLYAMALSPDGTKLAVGGFTSKNGIRIYDVKTGTLINLLKGHNGVVNSLAFSPDGTKLISGGGLSDRNAIIWDVASGSILHRLEGHTAEIYAVGFSPDGERAVTGSFDKNLMLWRAGDGGLIAKLEGHADKIQSLAFSPKDGGILSGDMSGEIRLWDGRSGRFIRTFAKQGGSVGSLVFSPGGVRLLSTCGGVACAYKQHVWDPATGREVTVYTGHHDSVLASTFSVDGTLAATAGSNNDEIHIWNEASGAASIVLSGTGKAGWAVGFSNDGSRIAWGNTYANPGGTVPINNRGPLEFEIMLPLGQGRLGHPEKLTSADGFTRAQSTFGAWSLKHTSGGPDGMDAAVLNISKDGKVVASIERGPSDGYVHRAYGFTPDGKTVISGGGNSGLSAYGLDGKKLLNFIGHESDVWAIAVSPDGKYLVSGSGDQTIRLWSIVNRQLLVTLFRGSDGEWVMWTPEGFYTGSEGASKLVGWHFNQGADKEARYINAGQLRKAFLRPDLVAAKIQGDPDGLVRRTALRIDIEELLKSAIAPEVSILSPSNGAKQSEASIAVTARIGDQGGGVGAIRFKLNGQVVGSAYGAGLLARDGTITRSFDLATAETTIEIVAEDKSGQVQSLPVSVKVSADEKAIRGIPDLYILAIGVDRYHDARKTLSFAVKDASALGTTLKQAGAGFYRNSPNVTTLLNEEVTAEKVEAAFKSLSAKVKATDVFLFYMAGHGKTVEGDFHFLPPAMSGFSEEAIKNEGFGPSKLSAWFELIKAQKSIWIFDTCESGSAERLFRVRDATADDAAYKRLKDATGRTLFMAASEQQSALEGYKNHGVFTYALLEGLAKAGREDKVQLFDLADYVASRVPEISRELKSCDAKGPNDYCQKPIVPIHSGNYPIVPRYSKILAELDADRVAIGAKPTHVLVASAEISDAPVRGGSPSPRQLKAGDLVTVIDSKDGWARVAQEGRAVGFVEEKYILRLNY